tara:strand:+ start:3491 stop:4201 length:711 start_codon:yes stop_codon:yes gene_type:complete
MQLFYNPDIKPNDEEVIFPKDESKHIVKVLRKTAGDILDLTNGSGYFFKAEITHSSPSRCSAKILNSNFQETLPYNLHMAVAPTKLNDRFEWFLEKATEIGITEITPIICDHSERKVIKKERYDRIIQSAMKQSLKAYLPQLNEAISFENFIEKSKSFSSQKYIAHCEETQRFSLKNALHSSKDICILIGPEGDFSTTEINSALTNNFKPVILGESRLRTETAAIVACHTTALHFE